ncbi:MAG: sensor histidine kinase [Propioniciclava sp.]
MSPPEIEERADGSGSLSSFALRWNRLRRAWDLIFVAMLCLIAWPVTTRLPGGVSARVMATAGIVLTALVFAVLGWWSRRIGSAALATISVAVAWALLWALTRIGLASGTWPLFAPLLIQMWASVPASACIAMTFLGAFGSAFSWWGLRAPDLGPDRALTAMVESITYGVTLTLFSFSLGLLVTRMLSEAHQLAGTVDELHRTQSRLFSAEREQGRLNERQRVAREIHDTVAQGLISLVALSRAAQVAVTSRDEPRALKHLRLIESTAVENLSEARIMVANLSPDHLNERTLVQAITRVVDLSNEEGGIEHTLTIEGEARPLGAQKDLTALRVVQEALANVHRHSLAQSARVELAYGPKAVNIRISDDGIGFDSAAPRSGYGLDGMSARVRDIGGDFTLNSQPGAGTAVTVGIPT